MIILRSFIGRWDSTFSGWNGVGPGGRRLRTWEIECCLLAKIRPCRCQLRIFRVVLEIASISQTITLNSTMKLCLGNAILAFFDCGMEPLRDNGIPIVQRIGLHPFGCHRTRFKEANRFAFLLLLLLLLYRYVYKYWVKLNYLYNCAVVFGFIHNEIM